VLRQIGEQAISCVHGMVEFSRMAPGTRLRPHCARCNGRLRIHLPLIVPRFPRGQGKEGKELAGEQEPEGKDENVGKERGAAKDDKQELGEGKEQEQGSVLRVGATRTRWVEGQPIVFDDSFEHDAAWLHPAAPRTVLIVDLWHPDLRTRQQRLDSIDVPGT